MNVVDRENILKPYWLVALDTSCLISTSWSHTFMSRRLPNKNYRINTGITRQSSGQSKTIFRPQNPAVKTALIASKSSASKLQCLLPLLHFLCCISFKCGGLSQFHKQQNKLSARNIIASRISGESAKHSKRDGERESGLIEGVFSTSDTPRLNISDTTQDFLLACESRERHQHILLHCQRLFISHTKSAQRRHRAYSSVCGVMGLTRVQNYF